MIYLKSLSIKEILKVSMSNFVVNTVFADDHAPIGARASVGTLLNNFQLHI